MADRWGRTVCDTRCQGRQERQLCSPPRVAAGMGRESPGVELGVPCCCTPTLLCCCIGIWEHKSFSWVILAVVAESLNCVRKLKRINSCALQSVEVVGRRVLCGTGRAHQHGAGAG